MHTEMGAPFASLFDCGSFHMILVTGATGFIGRHLVKKFLDEGVPLYALTRKDSLFLPQDEKLTAIKGDINRLTELPQDVTCIYHCAGVISREELMVETNVNGTRNIADIAFKKNCRLIYLSSAGVIGKCDSKYVDEETECKPQNLYESTKFEAEMILKEYADRGLKVRILRPTIVFGAHKDHSEDSFLQFISAIQSGRYVNIAGGKGIYNIVHVDEVVRALCILDNNQIPDGQTFFINFPISFNEFSRIVREETSRDSYKIYAVPYAVAWFAATAFALAHKATGRRMPLTFDRLRALTNKKIFNQKRLMDVTGYRPAKSVEEYIKQTCQEYYRQGLLN